MPVVGARDGPAQLPFVVWLPDQQGGIVAENLDAAFWRVRLLVVEQGGMDTAGGAVGKADHRLAQAFVLDPAQHWPRVGEDFNDGRADDPEEGVYDVPAVVEGGATALAFPRAGPAPVVGLGTVPVQLDAGAAERAELAAGHRPASQNHTAGVARTALGVELYAGLANGSHHRVGLRHAAGHRPLGEDVPPGLGRRVSSARRAPTGQ